MKMRGKLGIFILFTLVVLPLASAIETPITIKTIPTHEVQITAHDPATVSFTAFDGGKFTEIANEFGDVNVVFSSNEFKFNLIIYIKKDGDNVMPPQRVLNHIAGEPLYLELAPSWFEFIPTPGNETNETETNLTAEAEETGEGITGEVIADEETTISDEEADTESGSSESAIGNFFSSTPFYIILGVLVLAFVIIGTMKYTQQSLLANKQTGLRTRKLSDLKKEKTERIESFRDVIGEAEKRIRQAQSEIKRLSDSGKIKAMEKKIEQDKRDLERLKQGKDAEEKN